MFGWHDSEKAHQEFYNGEEMDHHHAKFSHELIAGAASYQAMKAFNNHHKGDAEEGGEVKHEKAKNIIAGLVGAEIDRLAETKGRDAWDKHKLKKQAEDNAKNMYDEKYGGQ